MRRLTKFSCAIAVSVRLAFPSLPSAFAAPIYSFTTAGVSGNTGPTQAQVNTAYTGTTLAGLVTVNTQGIQEWTVPTTGEYSIELAGASGGYTPGAVGGKGRIIKIRTNLTAGNTLKILVGQEGGRIYFTTGYAGGGGGGTYIYNSTTSSYIAVAGGGGGAAQGNTSYVTVQPGVDAAAYNSTSGTSGTGFTSSWSAAGAGGTAGGAGGSSSGGSSGAGINANGVAGSYGGSAGVRFLSGGAGGTNLDNATSTTNIQGGFGGGSAAGVYPNYEADAGGGGGYSGGGAGASRVGAGGGGGNYFTGTYVSSSTNTGHGYVLIQMIAIPTVSMTIAGGATSVNKTQPIALTAVVDDYVKVTFYANGKRIPGCIGISASPGNVTCNWKPSSVRAYQVYAAIYQGGTFISNSPVKTIATTKRTSLR